MESTGEKASAVAFVVGVAVAVIAILALVFIPVYKTITASGKVDYCYVETYTYHTPTQPDVVVFTLVGFRDWRGDRTLAQNLKSMDEVRDAAEKYGCTLK